MARGIYFSGDLEGLNRGMDSEERNRIAGRTGNQAFLANLAGTAMSNQTARRGQDTQERISGRQFDTQERISGRQFDTQERIAGRSADVASQGNRFNFDAAMARNATDRERIGAALEEIRQRESEGLRVDGRAKEALQAAALDNNAQRATMEKIAQISADATTGRLDPRSQQAAIEINASIADSNAAAQQAAALANQSARTRSWANPASWWGSKFDHDPSDGDLVSGHNSLSLDQRALVQIVPKKDATGKVIGTEIVPILRPLMPTSAQAPSPGDPTPAPSPGDPTPAPSPGDPTPAPSPAPGPDIFNPTNRVIQAPRVTPLVDIERWRRNPTNQAPLELASGPTNQVMEAEEDPYAGWVPPAVPFPYEDSPMATNRPVFATPPIAAPRNNRGFTVSNETPQEILLQVLAGNNRKTRPLLERLRRQTEEVPMSPVEQVPASIPQMTTMDPRYAEQMGLPVQYRPRVRAVSGEPAADMQDRLMRGRNRFSDAIMR